MRDVPYESTEGYVTRDSRDFKLVASRSIGRSSPGRHKINIEEQKEMSGYEAASFSEVPESAVDQKYYSSTGSRQRTKNY